MDLYADTYHDFRQLGAIRARGVQSYQVLGERCSGTNFLDALIRDNTHLRGLLWQPWKHGFPALLAMPDDALLVVVVRNALDWVRSLFAKPWHSGFEIRRLPFDRFLRSEWDGQVDGEYYFELPPDDSRLNRPLQYDRHPLTGRCFPNVVELRNAKLAAHLGLLNREINVAIVTHEELADDPTRFLLRLAGRFGIALRDVIRVPEGDFGASWAGRQKLIEMPPKGLLPEDRAFVLSQLDLNQELALGYSYPPAPAGGGGVYLG